MKDSVVELAEQPEPVREAVLECEVRGRRTLFTRGGRPVALLVSWDEYLALGETVAIAGDPDLLERMRTAEPAREDDDPELAAARAALAANPIAGVPLFPPLRGFWSFRSGPVRVIYRLTPDQRLEIVHAGRTAEAAP